MLRLSTSNYPQAVRSQITEAQKIAGGSGNQQDIAEAKIELEASIPLNNDRLLILIEPGIGARESAGFLEINRCTNSIVAP